MEYVDVKTAANRWNLTERRVTMRCRNGRIDGAQKENGLWMIPADAQLDISQRQEQLWEGVREILTQLSKLS